MDTSGYGFGIVRQSSSFQSFFFRVFLYIYIYCKRTAVKIYCGLVDMDVNMTYIVYLEYIVACYDH